MTTTATDDTMIVTLRVNELREIVRAAVAEALVTGGRQDLLDLRQVSERYSVGRDALLAAANRGEVELSQGPRRKFLIRAAELERWLTQKKYTPRDRTVPVDLEDWDRQVRLSLERDLASGRLRKLSPQEIEESKARRKQEQTERKRQRERTK